MSVCCWLTSTLKGLILAQQTFMFVTHMPRYATSVVSHSLTHKTSARMLACLLHYGTCPLFRSNVKIAVSSEPRCKRCAMGKQLNREWFVLPDRFCKIRGPIVSERVAGANAIVGNDETAIFTLERKSGHVP